MPSDVFACGFILGAILAGVVVNIWHEAYEKGKKAAQKP